MQAGEEDVGGEGGVAGYLVLEVFGFGFFFGFLDLLVDGLEVVFDLVVLFAVELGDFGGLPSVGD